MLLTCPSSVLMSCKAGFTNVVNFAAEVCLKLRRCFVLERVPDGAEGTQKIFQLALMSREGLGQVTGHSSYVAERAQLLLLQAGRYGLRTQSDCLEYLGKFFRVALDPPDRLSDREVCTI